MSMMPDKRIADAITRNNRAKEDLLSGFAFRSDRACRFKPAMEDMPDAENVRPAFAHDTDRIIHSRAYSRYIDKTQVFYLIENDHISHRVLHVQLVAKIARTIGRCLNLNEDLIEAISLGHDVGHAPFGHLGETIISEFLARHDAGAFLHNVQSFRLFHELERGGEGLNLSLQALDGMICHNGEVLDREYGNAAAKTGDDLLAEYSRGLVDPDASKAMVPMTLEGCVMRVSDVIAYVGRDIEDAIKVNLVARDDIPRDIVRVLGDTNSRIVDSLIVDIVNNSYEAGAVAFSPEVFGALDELKDWNHANIYANPRKTTQDAKIRRMFDEVLEHCLLELASRSGGSPIEEWASAMKGYGGRTNPARIVADYVSGMTDDFIMALYRDLTLPKSFGYRFD